MNVRGEVAGGKASRQFGTKMSDERGEDDARVGQAVGGERKGGDAQEKGGGRSGRGGKKYKSVLESQSPGGGAGNNHGQI